MPSTFKEVFLLGPFQLTVPDGVITCDGKPVQLTPRAAGVLAVLAAHANEVVGKDALMQAVWPDTFVEEGNLAVHISALRKLLAGAGGEIQIETIPKRGYRLVGEILVSDPASPGPANAADISASVSHRSGRGDWHVQRPRLAWWLAVPIVAVCVGAISFRIESRKGVSRADETVAATGGVSVRTPNPEALDLYLKGRYYWDKRTPDGLNKAVDYFTQAIVKDPGYAQAYVGLADCYNLLREYTLMPANEAYQRALSAATRAVALDPSSAEAHSSLGFALFYGSWDAAGAEREFKRAIELNPQYVPAHHWYATFLMAMGRSNEALAEIEEARRLNPTSTAILADKGIIRYAAGQQDQRIALLKQVETSEPEFLSSHAYLAGLYLTRQDYSQFLVESKAAAGLLHDENALMVIKAAENGLANDGGGQGLLKCMLQAQEKLYRRGLMSPLLLARTAALLGQKEDALNYLQDAYVKHDSGLTALRDDPALESLHGETKYCSLLAKVGLPPLP